MMYIDMHCDTLMCSFIKKSPSGIDYLPKTAVDLRRIEGNVAAQFFAVFLPPREEFLEHGDDITDLEYIESLRNIFHTSLEKNNNVKQAFNANDIRTNMSAGLSSAVLTMEDGRAVDSSLDRLRQFHDQGFRAIALTWNMENCFGYPNSRDPEKMSLGLKSFGKDAVRYMQELGILVDVSHLSDGGFWDVAELCQKPFIASHSNCRALSPHPRNLTDEMIRALADKGGVAGLNFLPGFVEADTNADYSSAASIAKQARHMANVGGIECVAIGTDFDGFSGGAEISDCTKMDLLFTALEKEGFTSRQLELIARDNILRVMDDAVK